MRCFVFFYVEISAFNRIIAHITYVSLCIWLWLHVDKVPRLKKYKTYNCIYIEFIYLWKMKFQLKIDKFTPYFFYFYEESLSDMESCPSRILLWILWSNLITWKQLTPWWRHQMETFSASLTLCSGNSPVPSEFPAQRPVTRSFDVFFDLRPIKQLSKQSLRWWFETPSGSLWRHWNVIVA